MKRLTLTIIFLICMSLNGANALENNPASKFGIAISSDAEKIAYSVNGNGKTTLMFIHGWSLDSRLWHNQIRNFSDEYQVVTIDFAGHGNSTFN